MAPQRVFPANRQARCRATSDKVAANLSTQYNYREQGPGHISDARTVWIYG